MATGVIPLSVSTFGDGGTNVTLDVNTDIDYYSFVAPADATGKLNLSFTGATFTPRVALFDASGGMVAGPSSAINYNAVVPGQAYRVAVFSESYASTGTAAFSFNFSDLTAVVTMVAAWLTMFALGGETIAKNDPAGPASRL